MSVPLSETTFSLLPSPSSNQYTHSMSRKVSKQQAAQHLGVSSATIDRMILRGELYVEREPWGSRYRVWVLLDLSEHVDTSVITSAAINTAKEATTIAALLERLAGLEKEIEAKDREITFHKELAGDWEYRYHELVQSLPKALASGQRSLFERVLRRFRQ